jgi:hypothetical protein
MSNQLSKEERSMINRRAHNLALRIQQQAYEAYRLRLVEWAVQEKMRGGVAVGEEVSMQTPDISDMLGDE